MSIRKARSEDEKSIMNLLNQLGYPDTTNFLKDKMKLITNNPNAELLVYEMDKEVIAFIAIDFIIQLGLKGDFARISYLAVDTTWRGKGVGKALEEYCELLAIKRKCDRIELHCNEHRNEAHQFCKEQGYIASKKYPVKMIKMSINQ